ncbi:MAG: outer membrane protein transport protein [Bacteroidales bacterium]|nr:outer membrane protein transport protein [Bacteroidales bacterium]
MKKFLSIATTLIAGTYLMAQSYLSDAIRVYDNYYKGTARTAAMGNAFSSLGGDMGAIPTNPASLGVYQSNELLFSTGLLSYDNNSSFYGTSYKETGYKFDISSAGILFNRKLDASEDWKTVNFYFGYNKLNNLNSIFSIRGITPNTTMMNEFVSYANSSPNSLDSYFEQLAYDLYVLDYDTINNKYFSPYSGIPLRQQRSIETAGSLGEFSFGLGANYNHVLYLGFTINARSGYYEDVYHHTEIDVENKITDYSYTFNYQLMTWVNGWNAKFGIIYRPIEPLRIGIGIHTPSVLKMRQEMYTTMTAVDDNGQTWSAEPKDSRGNNLGNFLDRYTFTTPFRTVIGVSYLFGERGLVSVDYERADYSRIKVTSADDQNAKDYTNDDVKSFLKATNNLRAGGELKLNSFYIRGGLSYYQSPYKSGQINDKANTYIYSGGIGYRTKSIVIDFAYTLTQRSEKYYLYDDNNLYPAKLETGVGSYLLTFGLRF